MVSVLVNSALALEVKSRKARESKVVLQPTSRYPLQSHANINRETYSDYLTPSEYFTIPSSSPINLPIILILQSLSLLSTSFEPSTDSLDITELSLDTGRGRVQEIRRERYSSSTLFVESFGD